MRALPVGRRTKLQIMGDIFFKGVEYLGYIWYRIVCPLVHLMWWAILIGLLFLPPVGSMISLFFIAREYDKTGRPLWNFGPGQRHIGYLNLGRGPWPNAHYDPELFRDL